MATFETLSMEILRGYFLHNPTTATDKGEHSYDSAWPDLSHEGKARYERWIRESLTALEALDVSRLSREERIDRRSLTQELENLLFREVDLREDEWNPLSAVYLLGEGLFSLLSREFAPWPQRLNSALDRIRGIPKILDEFKQNHLSPQGMPVSTLHTEKAIQRIGGITELVLSAVEEAKKLESSASAEEKAKRAEFADRILENQLLPLAKGTFRLTKELYLKKFKHSLRSDITPEELLVRAKAEFSKVRAEMTRIARLAWPTWKKGLEIPTDDVAVIKGVLNEVAAEHTGPAEILDFCRAENSRIEAFIKERDLIGLAEEPLKIIWTPEFLRSTAGAMLMSPGPLDKNLDTFFAVTPIPDDWTAEQKESYLREDNKRMLQLLTIHEAVPGHYLQLAYSNRCSSLIRNVFTSGVFCEGWAVWATQLMIDEGFAKDDLGLLLSHWKFYLRAVTNAIMDISIHYAGTMDRDEAMKLMVEGGFQELSEASAKWDRACLTSTQLCEYYLGSSAVADVVNYGRKKIEAEGGVFKYRPFLETVLAHGTPSVSILREILFQ